MLRGRQTVLVMAADEEQTASLVAQSAPAAAGGLSVRFGLGCRTAGALTNQRNRMTSMTRRDGWRMWITMAALWLAAAAVQAQTYSSPNSGPFRTLSDGADAKLMLLGHDAVAYFTQNE